MKTLLAAAACLFAVSFVNQVWAQTCPSGSSRVADVQLLVGGNTLCASRGSDLWQEFHSGAGAILIDYKKGPSDPVDRTERVGTWTATNGADYLWSPTPITADRATRGGVCAVGTPATSYTLVSSTGGTITGATLRTGQVACQ